jgi:succinate dehydrogenase / fumarate reductase cytochrome b subunit
MAQSTQPRPVFRNIHVTDIARYRLPAAGLVSILHRVSGALMFVLLPFVIWMFDASVTSEITYARFAAVFSGGFGGFFAKLVALALIWAYLHHLVAGVRHLWMDATHSVGLQQGRSSAMATLAISLLLTLALAGRLFGLY